jgi:hypothetical protein
MFYEWPKTPNYKNFRSRIGRHELEGPVTLRGTVKLDGTNAAVIVHPWGRVTYQSRSRAITPEDDNHGFARAMRDEVGEAYLARYLCSMIGISDPSQLATPAAFFGEWFGPGVQRGSTHSKLRSKYFVVFACRPIAALPETVDPDPTVVFPGGMVRTIQQVSAPWELEANIETLDSVVPEIDRIRDEVSERDPAAYSLEGLQGPGEGVVWDVIDAQGFSLGRFKHKGAKPGKSDKKPTKTYGTENAFVMEHFTEHRLRSGLERLSAPYRITQTGAYVKAAVPDFLVEVEAELQEAGLKPVDIKKAASKYAADWFKKEILSV